MPESETEDEILDRIETALRKIASAAQAPRPLARDLDRVALSRSLDMLISRLRAGLDLQGAADEHYPE